MTSTGLYFIPEALPEGEPDICNIGAFAATSGGPATAAAVVLKRLSIDGGAAAGAAPRPGGGAAPRLGGGAAPRPGGGGVAPLGGGGGGVFGGGGGGRIGVLGAAPFAGIF